MFFPAQKKRILRIMDFDETITIAPSFHVPLSLDAVRANLKLGIGEFLCENGSVFSICSYLDNPVNIEFYLEVLFGAKPALVQSEVQFLDSPTGKQPVLAYTLRVYQIVGLDFPICVTTLPARSMTPDPITGEKNAAYHRAREALAANGMKNAPIKKIIAFYRNLGWLPRGSCIKFYDDDPENARKALEIELPESLHLQSLIVSKGISTFQVEPVPRQHDLVAGL